MAARVGTKAPENVRIAQNAEEFAQEIADAVEAVRSGTIDYRRGKLILYGKRLHLYHADLQSREGYTDPILKPRMAI